MDQSFTEYRYHAMHMHLHCGHQNGASMASHMHNAQLLGMRYIRFTPHDNRTGPKSDPVTGFDFTKGALVCEDYPGKKCGWEMQGSPELCFVPEGLRLSSPDGSSGSCHGLRFFSSGKRHTVSLLSELSLTLDLSCSLSGNALLIVDVELSQRPPDHKSAHLVYASSDPGELPAHTAFLPLKADADGLYRLHLTRDVPESIGGCDNAFVGLQILLYNADEQSFCLLRSLQIHSCIGFDPVIQRQRYLGELVGQQYCIKPFITSEISKAGHHKNCLST